jgi:hypothetical protein
VTAYLSGPKEQEPVADPDAGSRFTAVYNAHHAQVYAYAVSRVGRQLADDIVGDTFLVAWRKLDSVPAAPLPWLLGVKALVMDLPVAPEVRAAGYRMMADIAGVKLLGTVTDQRGRPGMAVTYTREGDGGAGETRLVIDPHTGQALAEEHRNATGELTSYTLVDSAGFGDDAPKS